MNEKMNVQEKRKLREIFLTSEEQRQLRMIRIYALNKNLFKIRKEESLVSSDYSFLQEGDILNRLEEKVSKNGWIF